MKKILVSSSNTEVLEVVKKGCQKYLESLDPIFCPDTDEALSFIDLAVVLYTAGVALFVVGMIVRQKAGN